MDIKFRKPGSPRLDSPKNLPGFRGSSELPEHSLAEEGLTDKPQPYIARKNMDATVPTGPLSDADFESAFSDIEEADNTAAATTENIPGSTPTLPKPAAIKKPRNKKLHILILLIIFAIVAVASGTWYYLQKKSDKAAQNLPIAKAPEQAKAKVVVPVTKPAAITGIAISEELAGRPTKAIMIENSVDARPQSGLYDADMVVEAVAEGGITRFVALFQSAQPKTIGPIRSARPYYVQIAKTFDAAYIHAGGSPDALALVSDIGIKDMSAFEDNGTYYRSDERSAPHNLYSSMDKLDTRATELGYKTSSYAPFVHKNDTPQTPTASTINFTLSSQDFNPTFSYDIASNSYLRSEGGEPHMDVKNGHGQIAPKVIIGLITTKGSQDQYSTYRLTGNGEMRIFQDGVVSEGTWTKDKDDSQFVFKDKNGLPFGLNKGQIWMTLLGSPSNISFTP